MTVAGWGSDPIALGVPGDGVIAIRDGDPERVFAIQRTGDAFSRRRQLFGVPRLQELGDVGFDKRGRSIIVTDTWPARHSRVLVVFGSPTGRTTRAHALSPPSDSADGPALAVNRSGAAVAAWTARSRHAWLVEVATRAPGKPFGAAQTIGRSSRYVPSLHVAIGEAGHAMVAWHWQIGDGGLIFGLPGPVWASVATPHGRFGTARALGEGGEFPDLALDVTSKGRMLAAWIKPRASSQRLFVSERAAGAPFGAPRELATSFAHQMIENGGPVVSTGDDGSALVAWARPTGPIKFGRGEGVLEVFGRSPGGDFTAQTLTGALQQPKFPALGVGRAGQVVLAWTETPQPGPGEPRGQAVVRATIGTRGAPLPPATQLAAAAEDATWPTAAVTDAGEAIVAWLAGGFGSGPVRATVGTAAP